MTIKQALKQRVQPGEALPILLSDNGPQFLSHAFAEMCMDKDEPLIHERIPPKTLNMNAYIESFHSILERDLYSKMYFETFKEAYEIVTEYIGFYNERRFHGSINRLSPRNIMQLGEQASWMRWKSHFKKLQNTEFSRE